MALGIRLDGKIAVGRCRAPRAMVKLLGSSVQADPLETVGELGEIAVSFSNLSCKPSMSNGLAEYLLRQMEGWVVNNGDTIFLTLNGRVQNAVAHLPLSSGVIVSSTRVTISESTNPKLLKDPENSTHAVRGFAMIGGLDDVIDQLVINVRKPIQEQRQYTDAGLDPPRGILLFGPPGTGKTLLMKALADELEEAIIIQRNATDLTGADCDQRIHTLFRDSQQRCLDSKNNAVVIFIDEFDALCPSRDGAVGEQERRAVAAFLTEMDGLHRKSSESVQVIVIASTNRPHKIDIALRRPGRFEVEIEVRPPDEKGRYQILRVLSQGRFRLIWQPNDTDISRLASLTHGFVGSDLLSLISRAALKSIDVDNKKLSMARIMEELVHVKPSALREHAVSVPITRWSDIGGYDDVKEQLIETVVWPTVHANAFRIMNIQAPRGILLFGPPGCSKTMMARAIATESHMNFVSIKGPEIFSKWVGESEQSIRDLFRVARQASPCVIFFDEIDAIASNRNADDGGVSGRVLTQLLTEMDGVSTMNHVIVVAATNRPQVLDPALVRPGRLDRLVYVGLPDFSARVSILKSALSKIPHRIPETGNESLIELAKRTEGYTGAEIVMLAKEAAILCVRERIANQIPEELSSALDGLSLDPSKHPSTSGLNFSHLVHVLDGMNPRTDPDLIKALIAFKDKS